jgi:tetrapyrrole methylase family protein / MazG family protein
MDEFDRFVKTLEQLLGPEGCPWDRAQTMLTLRESVLEETCELIEAVDLDQNEHILEELGDLLLNVVFLCKVAEKENRFTTAHVINHINDKLIRRHPHVFGDAVVKDIDGLWVQWESIKAQEKGKEKRESVLDGIPKGLPALALAQKMLKRMRKAELLELPQPCSEQFQNEEALGDYLLSLVTRAQEAGLDAEQALRKAMAQLEVRFRDKETSG